MQGKDPTNYLYTPAAPTYYATYGHRSAGLLSREEKFNLAIAMGALTLCLTMVMRGGLMFLIPDLSKKPFVIVFTAVVAGATTATGFALHELAHKFVAQHYGCWAEFRYSTQGLFIALFTAAIGFLFAAPGAVYIAGNVGKRENGIISIAGPLTNVVVAVAMLPVAILFNPSLIAYAAITVAYFNAFLAAFNMIPIMPLDGAKVARWSLPIYVASLLLMVGLLAYTFIIQPSILP